MRRIFANIYEKKRLQPGNLTNSFESVGEFAHDCSTLGGNSGSCVLDLDTGLVIGLHYSGSYMHSNYAVSLWKLKEDAILKEAGVNFS
jgi:V8-like Glu-specific endopeptidase